MSDEEFENMRDEGASPERVCAAAKRQGLDKIALIAMLRRVSLSICATPRR